MSGARERANGRASGPVLTSLFLFVPDHSAVELQVQNTPAPSRLQVQNTPALSQLQLQNTPVPSRLQVQNTPALSRLQVEIRIFTLKPNQGCRCKTRIYAQAQWRLQVQHTYMHSSPYLLSRLQVQHTHLHSSPIEASGATHAHVLKPLSRLQVQHTHTHSSHSSRPYQSLPKP